MRIVAPAAEQHSAKTELRAEQVGDALDFSRGLFGDHHHNDVYEYANRGEGRHDRPSVCMASAKM